MAPPPRSGHAAAYDVVRSRLVLFGGQPLFGDTWELAGATWLQRTPAQSPPARSWHSMAYDIGRARIVLFGGTTNGLDSGARNDTWEWDGITWTQRFPALSPNPRLGHAMTADWVNSRVVLFGGRDIASTYRYDTWTWDGTNWTPLGAPGPSGRCMFDMVQDINRARIVLFGGWSGGSVYGDTWEFDGVAWQQRLPAISPAARYVHRMSYDPLRNRLIMHGGVLASAAGSLETWQWDGVTWTLLDTSINWRAHVLQYDWLVGRPTMFGGDNGTGVFHNRTWTFGVAAPATVTAFGSACPGPMGTPQLSRQGTNLPSIGQTVTLRAASVSTFALFLFGWSDTVSGSITLPYSLAPHGAPGCSVLVSPDAVFGVVAGPGSAATMPVNLPFAPSLVGLRLFNQAVPFDAGANPLGLTTSNGLRSTIGWQ